jgi:hypothetical protein
MTRSTALILGSLIALAPTVTPAAMESGDLVHWEDVTDRLSLPAGVRHGTALAVPGGVLAPLQGTDLPPVSAPTPR